jgi:acetoin utilization protein AcuB
MAKVKDIMTENVLTARVSTPFAQLVNVFVNMGINHLPIINNDGSLRAIFSSSDALEAIHEVEELTKEMEHFSFMKRVNVNEEMTTEVLSVTPNTKINDAIKMMVDHSIHALPVMQGENIVGIISSNDVLKAIHDGKIRISDKNDFYML